MLLPELAALTGKKRQENEEGTSHGHDHRDNASCYLVAMPLQSRPSDLLQLPLNDFICPTWANVNAEEKQRLCLRLWCSKLTNKQTQAHETKQKLKLNQTKRKKTTNRSYGYLISFRYEMGTVVEVLKDTLRSVLKILITFSMKCTSHLFLCVVLRNCNSIRYYFTYADSRKY